MSITLVRKIPGAKIAAYTEQGVYVLNHVFAHRDDPKLFETLEKVRERGQIDLRFWHMAKRGEA